jgi:hypothetical protein
MNFWLLKDFHLHANLVTSTNLHVANTISVMSSSREGVHSNQAEVAGLNLAYRRRIKLEAVVINCTSSGVPTVYTTAEHASTSACFTQTGRRRRK